MRLRPVAVLAAASSVLALVALSIGACQNTDDCYPGSGTEPPDHRGCACDNGKPGYQACTADKVYGECDCGGNVIPTGSGGGGDGGDGKLPFAAPCMTDEMCESGLCFKFTAKGPHCSKPCMTAADCPLPFVGCNGMGVCKVP